MNQLDEKVFLQEICRRLDASIELLPNSVRSQLDANRQAALHSAHSQHATDSFANSISSELNEQPPVPAEIEAQLNQIRAKTVARYEQLQTKSTSSGSTSFTNWLKNQFDSFNFAGSAGMLATACVLITAISIFYINSRPTGTLTFEEEIGLVATAEDIELYENLEFYLWLAENESLSL